MNELIQIAFSSVNLFYTFLLILVIIYWLSIIVGIFDFGSFDLDFDIDSDLDVEVDADIEAGSVGAFAGFLHFFNFGKLPFMIIISFVSLAAWSISVLVNDYFGNESLLFAMGLLLPNLLVSLLFAKMVTTPLIPVFEKLDTGVAPVDYIGMTAKLLLPTAASKMGQAEVLIEDSPLLINVKLDSESLENLKKGEEVIILRKEKNKNFYIIKKLNNDIY